MSEVKSKNNKKVKEVVQESETSENDDSDNEVIEIRRPKLSEETSTKPRAKPRDAEAEEALRQRKLASMTKAREVKNANLKAKREQDAKAQALIERAYKAEMEQELVKTTLPKYSKAIKKDILEKLKREKLEQLKKQYGYNSDESESDSSSDEEEMVVVKKKKPVKKEVKIKATPEPIIATKKSLLQTYKDFGF